MDFVAGEIRVTYYSQHAGHQHDIAHQRLSRDQRAHVAGLLSLGIHYDDVLDRVQLSGHSTHLSRLHLINKQDLKNIARDYNISKGERFCQNDADSVAAWVEANRQDGDRCLVRYVKFQGDVDEDRHLRADDFCLVIISEAQIAGLQQLNRPSCEVAMDSTHGTNAYDFQLTTLMLVDENGEGFPAAFCFSNRVDEIVMHAFLCVCKENFGVAMNDVVFMSDDAEVYANAWTRVMGQPVHRLLCTWHIDRAWRKNMSKVKGDSILKATIYKTLRALMEITDRDVFAQKLTEFMESAMADEKTVQFAEYFNREYVSRPQLWAYCYRLGLHVHHNMHLEALHRVLKHVHMNGRKVRRMDSCIHALMRLLRMKMRDRLQKLHKGKWTRHLHGIRIRHKKGLSMDSRVITEVMPNQSYAVQGRDLTVAYMVEQSDSVPHENSICPLQCKQCGICIHTFVCNCVDFGLRNTICKHIHAVVSRFSPVISATPMSEVHLDQSPSHQTMHDDAADDADCVLEDDNVITEEVIGTTTRIVRLNETTEILSSLGNTCSDTVDTYIREAEVYWSAIRGEMMADANIAAAACEQLKRVMAYLSALKQQPQLPQLANASEPANKKAEKQRFFTSTKKPHKKRKPEATISKPDTREKALLLQSLSGEVEVVSRSYDGDHDYDVCGSRVAFEHSY